MCVCRAATGLRPPLHETAHRRAPHPHGWDAASGRFEGKAKRWTGNLSLWRPVVITCVSPSHGKERANDPVMRRRYEPHS